MSRVALNIFSDCQPYSVLNTFKNVDSNNVSSQLEGITNDIKEDNLNEVLENVIKLFPNVVSEIESTEFNLQESKEMYNQTLAIIEGIGLILNILDRYTIDELLLGRFICNLRTCYKNMVIILETFEDYVNVLEAREDIDSNDLLTLEEAFGV